MKGGDCLCSPTAATDLSQQRAEAVRSALQPLVKVAGLRFEVSGKGEREPIADNGTDEGRQTTGG